ncbi:hypothetical protein ACIQ9P_01765 [Kitasatospora sp. NPDC094019]|uniref:hypothetical protein n=1 Tax=Kitasatospora sp. NPDC094019 TaxID=3364091 RepID=UPI00380C3E82
MPDVQRRIVAAAREQLLRQSGGHGGVRPVVDGDGPRTRLLVLAPGASSDAAGRYRTADALAVLEVVPVPDPAGGHRAHADARVPLYVVVDPGEAVCTVHSRPLPGVGYREAERVPFGNDLFLPLGERTLVLETGDFPVEPPTPGAAAG